MKKTLQIIFIFFLVFLGLSIGVNDDRWNSNFEERKNKFEDEIITPGNNFQSESKNQKFEPSIINDIGKKGEKAIEKVFDFSFGLLKKIIE